MRNIMNVSQKIEEHIFDNEDDAMTYYVHAGFAIKKERRGNEFVWIVSEHVVDQSVMVS